MKKISSRLSSSRLYPPLVAASALGISFAVAYAADSILYQLQEKARTTFDFGLTTIAVAAPPLIMAATMLALAWLVFVRLAPSKTVAAIFVIGGLFVAAEYLSFLVSFPLWLRDTVIGRFRYELMRTGGRHLYSLASFWIVLGIAGFLRRSSAGGARTIDP
jgi:hypothetical protein